MIATVRGRADRMWWRTATKSPAMTCFDMQVDGIDAAVADTASLGTAMADTQPQAHVGVMFDPDGRPIGLSQESE